MPADRTGKAAPNFVVGLDCGTTEIKAVAFDHSGAVVACGRRPSPTRVPAPRRSEADMNRLWLVAAEALRELAQHVAHLGGQPVALGISGTMGGAWLIDPHGQPVRNAILWNDGRAIDILHDWRRDGSLARIFDVSANMPTAGFMLSVLRWLSEHEPEALRRASHALFCKDWLRLKLTGEIGTEESDASHAPGDVRSRDFSPELLQLCGLNECRRLLPPRVPSGSIVGTVTPSASETTGLPVGLPVIAGLADVSATLVGAGAITPGVAVTVAGTSLLNCVVTREPMFTPREIGVSFLIPGGLHARAMPNQTGALAIDWFAARFLRDPVGQPLSPEQRDRVAESVPPGAGGVLFHPYLGGTGVIAPIHAPAARGQFAGLSIEHSTPHLLRAVYEGVALSMADCLDALPPTSTVRLVGGLSRSGFFSQLCADVTGRTIETMSVADAGALGVAMLAGVAVGLFADMDQASRACCTLDRRFEPEQARHDAYRAQLARYRRVRDRLVEESWSDEERITWASN